MSTETMGGHSDVVTVSQNTPAQTVETKADAPKESATAKPAVETKHDESDASDEHEDEETGEESDEGSDESSEQDRPKKKSGYKKRVEKLLSRERAALERAEKLERELQAFREQASKGQSPKSEEQAPSKAATDDGAPDPDQFDTVAEYMRAVAKHELAQEKKAQEAKAKEEAARSEYENLTKTHQERLEKFKAETPDYLDVVQEAVADLGSDYRLNPALEMSLKGSEYSAQMFYELAKKGAEEIHRINTLPYPQMIRELTRIEVRLEAQKESKAEIQKPEIKKPKAPTPLTSVKAKGGTAAKSLHDMDYDDFKKARESQR